MRKNPCKEGSSKVQNKENWCCLVVMACFFSILIGDAGKVHKKCALASIQTRVFGHSFEKKVWSLCAPDEVTKAGKEHGGCERARKEAHVFVAVSKRFGGCVSYWGNTCVVDGPCFQVEIF